MSFNIYSNPKREGLYFFLFKWSHWSLLSQGHLVRKESTNLIRSLPAVPYVHQMNQLIFSVLGICARCSLGLKHVLLYCIVLCFFPTVCFPHLFSLTSHLSGISTAEVPRMGESLCYNSPITALITLYINTGCLLHQMQTLWREGWPISLATVPMAPTECLTFGRHTTKY